MSNEEPWELCCHRCGKTGLMQTELGAQVRIVFPLNWTIDGRAVIDSGVMFHLLCDTCTNELHGKDHEPPPVGDSHLDPEDYYRD